VGGGGGEEGGEESEVVGAHAQRRAAVAKEVVPAVDEGDEAVLGEEEELEPTSNTVVPAVDEEDEAVLGEEEELEPTSNTAVSDLVERLCADGLGALVAQVVDHPTVFVDIGAGQGLWVFLTWLLQLLGAPMMPLALCIGLEILPSARLAFEATAKLLGVGDDSARLLVGDASKRALWLSVLDWGIPTHMTAFTTGWSVDAKRGLIDQLLGTLYPNPWRLVCTVAFGQMLESVSPLCKIEGRAFEVPFASLQAADGEQDDTKHKFVLVVKGRDRDSHRCVYRPIDWRVFDSSSDEEEAEGSGEGDEGLLGDEHEGREEDEEEPDEGEEQVDTVMQSSQESYIQGLTPESDVEAEADLSEHDGDENPTADAAVRPY
jgi:hypothetical protein